MNYTSDRHLVWWLRHWFRCPCPVLEYWDLILVPNFSKASSCCCRLWRVNQWMAVCLPSRALSYPPLFFVLHIRMTHSPCMKCMSHLLFVRSSIGLAWVTPVFFRILYQVKSTAVHRLTGKLIVVSRNFCLCVSPIKFLCS